MAVLSGEARKAKCGQQALSVFVSGMVLSHVGGMVFDHIGTGLGPQMLVNGISIPALIAIAYGVNWFKNAPWRPGAAPTPKVPQTASAVFTVREPDAWATAR